MTCANGTCALQLTMRDPDAYTSAAALSPDFVIKEDPTTGNLFGRSSSSSIRISTQTPASLAYPRRTGSGGSVLPFS